MKIFLDFFCITRGTPVFIDIFTLCINICNSIKKSYGKIQKLFVNRKSFLKFVM